MSYRPRMSSSDALIETGRLPSGHPYARVGSGSRVVLSIPGLSFTAEVAKPASIRRSWKRWLDPIERHDLTFVDVGRRADFRQAARQSTSPTTTPRSSASSGGARSG